MGQSKREVIDISDWSKFKKAAIIDQTDYYWKSQEADGLDEEGQEKQIQEWEKEWNQVKKNIVYFDLDKCYVTYEVILKHIESSKFYSARYGFSYSWPNDYNNVKQLQQVFARPTVEYR